MREAGRGMRSRRGPAVAPAQGCAGAARRAEPKHRPASGRVVRPEVRMLRAPTARSRRPVRVGRHRRASPPLIRPETIRRVTTCRHGRKRWRPPAGNRPAMRPESRRTTRAPRSRASRCAASLGACGVPSPACRPPVVNLPLSAPSGVGTAKRIQASRCFCQRARTMMKHP